MLKYTTLLLLLLLSVLVHGDSIYQRLFTHGPAFTLYPHPTFTIYSPELGRSGSFMPIEYTQDGSGRFPALDWKSPSPAVKEWLLIVEDPEIPLPHPVVHGVYYGIPPVFTGLANEDFRGVRVDYDAENEGAVESGRYNTTGGFKFGKNRGGGVYMAPHREPGRGVHRYFFEIVALNAPVNSGKLGVPVSVEDLSQAIEGKVVGWGAWIGLVKRV